LLWEATEHVGTFGRKRWPPEAVAGSRAFEGKLRDAVMATGPMLTATERLHQIYAHALRAAAAASEIAWSVEEWQRERSEDLGVPSQSESARLEWWSRVVGPWERLTADMATFADRAVADRDAVGGEDQLGARPWHKPAPAWFLRARRELDADYPGT
jgi:hypothetical protein